jgi:hypothetical protein
MNVYSIDFSVVYSSEVEEKLVSQCTYFDIRILRLINLQRKWEYLHITLIIGSYLDIERVIFALGEHYTYMSNRPFDLDYSRYLDI